MDHPSGSGWSAGWSIAQRRTRMVVEHSCVARWFDRADPSPTRSWRRTDAGVMARAPMANGR